MRPRTLLSSITLLAALSVPLAGARAFDESKYPDWSGQWLKADGGAPRYDPSKPEGRGQQAPLKEPYRKMHEASLADQAIGGQGLYISSVKCVPLGMPFQMGIVFPFEFVITEKTTFVLYEIMTSRRPAASIPTAAIGPRLKTRPSQATRSADGSIPPAAVAMTPWRSRRATCACRAFSTRPGFQFQRGRSGDHQGAHLSCRQIRSANPA